MYVMNDPHASFRLLARELKKRGYSSTEFVQAGKRHLSLTDKQGHNWTTPIAKIGYPLQSKKFIEISRSKQSEYEFAESVGMSVPRTRVLKADERLARTDRERILKDFKTAIVKPADASLSRGLTLEVTDEADLARAVKHAQSYHEDILIQQQVYGQELRFAILNGTVIAVLLRETPRVIGDGKRTVIELIAAENKLRERIKGTYVQYPALTTELSDEVLSRVLPAGEIYELGRSTMIRGGCSIYDVLPRVHESYVRKVEKLARAAEIGFGAVDVFIRDFTKPARAANYWLMELNTSPVLKLFYSCRDGKHFDVVPLLADAIDVHLKRQPKDPVLGSIEYVSMPELGMYRKEAKVDTGAYSGALHSTNARVIKTVDGTRVLRFSASDNPHHVMEFSKFRSVKVRSALGHQVKRYLIDTNIALRGNLYPITIGLSNRKDMQKEILIGRRFLREHGMLVDVRINSDDEDNDTAK